MPKRQYINLSISDLETITDNHWNDIDFLRRVKNELKYRKTKRAKELFGKIEKHLSEKLGQLQNGNKFCSECGELMGIKYGRHGMFWGCTGYPHCTYTVKVTKSDFN